MIVVDTAVLVYAVGGDHPLAEPCRRVVERITAGAVRASTTVEVLQEFVHVRARRRARTEAVDLARHYASLLAPLLVVDGRDLEAGLDLFERLPMLGAFDAVLAAAAQNRHATAVVSADRAFGDVPGLRHLDPAHPGFVDELTSVG